MLPKRIRISQLSTDTLKILKARTGLTPNIVCRIGLIRSLEAGAVGGKKVVDQSGSEFNASTLFGEYHTLFEALILQTHGYLGQKDMVDTIVSHIEDGVAQLRKSKNLLDFIEHCGSSVESGY